jgi:hypothetical protein
VGTDRLLNAVKDSLTFCRHCHECQDCYLVAGAAHHRGVDGIVVGSSHYYSGPVASPGPRGIAGIERGSEGSIPLWEGSGFPGPIIGPATTD